MNWSLFQVITLVKFCLVCFVCYEDSGLMEIGRSTFHIDRFS